MPTNGEGDGGAQTILIVDDQDSFRRIMGRTLRRRGFEIAEASSGDAALSALAEMNRAVDLAVIDIVMPGMNGFALAERISRLYAGCKILFISGYPFATLERDYGMAAHLLPVFLPKPFGTEAFIAKVNELLGGGMTRGPL